MMGNSEPMDQDGWLRFKAALAQEFIEHLHARYKHTPNPIHALEAYRLSRAVKIDVPGWILELFDQWAEVLCVNPPKGGKATADALGLGSKGGPSITAQAKTQARNVTIGQRVLFLRDRNPEGDKLDIFHEVAEEFGLSSERVAAIWYELTHDIKP